MMQKAKVSEKVKVRSALKPEQSWFESRRSVGSTLADNDNNPGFCGPLCNLNLTDLPVQAKAEPNRTGMPDQLKAGIETLTGIDMSDVRVHSNSEKPAQLDALAYAQGRDIHLAPGQEQHLPHEVWHLVQQRQGRVRPTLRANGMEINDEKSLESEADLMGRNAVQLKMDERRDPFGMDGSLDSPGKSGQLGLPFINGLKNAREDEWISAGSGNLIVQRQGESDSILADSVNKKEDLIEAVSDNEDETSVESDQMHHEREKSIQELLSYGTENDVEAMISSKNLKENIPLNVGIDGQPIQMAKEKNPRLKAMEQPPGKIAGAVKKQPSSLAGWKTLIYGGRTYFYRMDASARTRKIAGRIEFDSSARLATKKVGNKRKNDASGHLIAHSFGGPPTLTANYVAMSRQVNSAGGNWGIMEAYIRNRLKVPNTAAYMSVTPRYPNPSIKRPNEILVTVHFNRAPKKKRWLIPTP